MKPLRWKRQYQSGDPEQDRKNRDLTHCLNTLMEASRQREHCHDVEDLMERLADQADDLLRQGCERDTIEQTLRPILRDNLPLPSYETAACHNCGICDMARAKLASHLEAPAKCFDTAVLPRPK